MFAVQGTHCIIERSKKSFRKKPIQISLILQKNPNSSSAHRRYRSTFRNEEKSPLNGKPQLESESLQSVSVMLGSKRFINTPTPNRERGFKIALTNYSFDPPALPKSRMMTAQVEPDKSVFSKRKRLKSQENTEKKIDLMINRITMKDLGLNLPNIIKSRQVKKKSKYRPQLGDEISMY